MIGKIFEALQAGKELSNPEIWKNRQTTMNMLVVLLSGSAYLASILGGVTVSHDVITGVAEAIAIVLGLINAYLTTATSKKVGL